jgi:pyruvate/2-oxoglutarate dehydrogenase complex dihydrolipoamide dehydrogenase (E3) component
MRGKICPLPQKTDRLLGAHIIGPGAGEMINEVGGTQGGRGRALP